MNKILAAFLTLLLAVSAPISIFADDAKATEEKETDQHHDQHHKDKDAKMKKHKEDKKEDKKEEHKQ